jgi:hypothetical protein
LSIAHQDHGQGEFLIVRVPLLSKLLAIVGCHFFAKQVGSKSRKWT